MTTGHSYKMGALSIALFAATLLGSCNDEGGLVDDTYQGEPLAAVNGALSIEVPPNGGKISIAVAWLADYSDESTPEEDEVALDPDGLDGGESQCEGVLPAAQEVYRAPGNHIWALQAVTYDAVSLVNFSLPIMDLPPGPARADLAKESLGEGWIAFGMLIAFEDKNEDGIFDPGNPDSEGDRLLAVSYKETGTHVYEAAVVYVNGTIDAGPDSWALYEGLTSGFNILIHEFDGMAEDESFEFGMERTLNLYTVEPDTLDFMSELLCSEVEHNVHFNESFAPEDYATEPMCTADCGAMEYVDEDGNVQIETMDLVLEWSSVIPDANNPCILHEYNGAACFPGGVLPDDWSGLCADAIATVLPEEAE